MGKKKNGAYNDFLDGEKLSDNTEIRTENLNAAGMPDTDALCVDVRGLKSMHDNDGKGTGCLYAEVLDKTGRVEEFSASVRAEFERVGGMLVDEGRGLKLHATVLNTIYAKREILRARKKGVDGSGGGAGGGGGGGGREREDGQMQSEERAETGEKEKEKERSNNDDKDTTSHRPKSSNPLRFDARDLIQQYKDCTWATDVKIDRVCLCKMGARKVWSGGAEGVGEVVDEVYEVVAEKKIFV
ncbi:hypothetical protein NX059_008695 [Plenodomus lindquistii]|nr:hypothetical protein NX059_008695 [Plenodomus lindquistii]